MIDTLNAWLSQFSVGQVILGSTIFFSLLMLALIATAQYQMRKRELARERLDRRLQDIQDDLIARDARYTARWGSVEGL